MPVIAGKHFPQHDRQRPAVQHDVVIGQHKTVLVFGGADQRRPEGRPVGEIENCGAFGGAHPLDLLLEVQVADG